jgi:demethylmenaquinone methyltransferase/2-methoxy-6-polyprenyl-1,4-benzoquinol methylase
MFDRIAPRYDLLNRLLTGGLDQRWRRVALRTIGVGPGDRVLDLACGTGDLAEQAVLLGADVIGADFALQMLCGAQRRCLGAALVQADAEGLPLPDACVDVVTCGFALRNFGSLERVLDEVVRVLRPGGRIALLDVDRPDQPLIGAAHALYFDRVVPAIGGVVSDRDAYRYLPASTAYLPPADAFRAHLTTRGLEGITRRRFLFGVAQLWTGRAS